MELEVSHTIQEETSSAHSRNNICNYGDPESLDSWRALKLSHLPSRQTRTLQVLRKEIPLSKDSKASPLRWHGSVYLKLLGRKTLFHFHRCSFKESSDAKPRVCRAFFETASMKMEQYLCLQRFLWRTFSIGHILTSSSRKSIWCTPRGTFSKSSETSNTMPFVIVAHENRVHAPDKMSLWVHVSISSYTQWLQKNSSVQRGSKIQHGRKKPSILSGVVGKQPRDFKTAHTKSHSSLAKSFPELSILQTWAWRFSGPLDDRIFAKFRVLLHRNRRIERLLSHGFSLHRRRTTTQTAAKSSFCFLNQMESNRCIIWRISRSPHSLPRTQWSLAFLESLDFVKSCLQAWSSERVGRFNSSPQPKA